LNSTKDEAAYHLEDRGGTSCSPWIERRNLDDALEAIIAYVLLHFGRRGGSDLITQRALRAAHARG
jgi:hypothetical protein